MTFLVEFIALIIIIILIPIIVAITLPICSMLVGCKAKLTGRYLNRHFVISRRKDGTYVLHHHPFFGFYHADKRKFHRLLMDAIQKFHEGYPDLTLVAQTLTFQSVKRKGTPVLGSRFFLLGNRLMMDFLILRNLAHYRKEKGRWLFASYIRDVHRHVPMEYTIIGRE